MLLALAVAVGVIAVSSSRNAKRNPGKECQFAADPALGAAFIAAAARMLAPSGRLWLVANRALPYEAPLAAAFAHVERIADEGGFKVFAAARPRQRGVARASAIRDR